MSKKGKFFQFGIIVTLCLAFFGFNNGFAQDSSDYSLLSPATTWQDDFSSFTLNGAWTWIRENPSHWSLTANPGFMRILTHDGHLFEDLNNMENLLLQSAPLNNFMIETKVYLQPIDNFQGAGLLIYEDDDNRLSLIRAYCDQPSPICEGNAIYFDKEALGVAAGDNYPTNTTAPDVVYLRILRDGNLFTGYYSEDGHNWNLIGTHELIPDPGSLLGTLRIGLMAGQNNGPIVPLRPADFDYFLLITSTFSDVLPNHWAFQYINEIFNAGLTTGYPDGTYRPENPVTRAEMAVFLLNALGISPGPLPGVPSFSDIDGHWAEIYIEELYDQNITGGYPDGTYRPENRVTRAEMAVFLLNAIGVVPPTIDGSHEFNDIEGHWAEAFIEELYDQGITGGYPDGTYRPENRVTRAEMAVFLVSAFNITLP